MLAKLFSGAVNNLFGRETLKSEEYGFSHPHVVNYDAAGGKFYLEATPHIFDKTKYGLAEVVINQTARRLTPPDLQKVMEHTQSTHRNVLKDENGKPYALTRDEALKKIADYQAAKDKDCANGGSHYVSFHKIPHKTSNKPSAAAP